MFLLSYFKQYSLLKRVFILLFTTEIKNIWESFSSVQQKKIKNIEVYKLKVHLPNSINNEINPFLIILLTIKK